MKGHKSLHSKRVTAGIVAFTILVVMLFSVFYISKEAGHHCSGDDCPICACIQQCENTLKQVGGGAACQSAAMLPAIIFWFVYIFSSWSFCRESLVTKKVRLNN